MRYHCKHCGHTMKRNGIKKGWIKSYCDRVGKYVHMTLVKPKKKEERIYGLGLER